ncbi:uncharacterized protein G2W53_023999 [Senna tora]|uniref:Uncharacterized protein n=1 Tax=Senna tora TaxID=362788 RepID=A0A834TBI2_9FABA|nr:uncharacterized protein G2W53_023999 [Senna tora]
MNSRMLTEILEIGKVAIANHLTQKQEQPIGVSLLPNERRHAFFTRTQLTIQRRGTSPPLGRSIVHVPPVLLHEPSHLTKLALQIILYLVLLLATWPMGMAALCSPSISSNVPISFPVRVVDDHRLPVVTIDVDHLESLGLDVLVLAN